MGLCGFSLQPQYEFFVHRPIPIDNCVRSFRKPVYSFYGWAVPAF